MRISDWIKEEDWNGGKWIETFCNKYPQSFSLQVTPNSMDDKTKFIILTLDEPYEDKEEPWCTIIPDYDCPNGHRDYVKIVEKIYEENFLNK